MRGGDTGRAWRGREIPGAETGREVLHTSLGARAGAGGETLGWRNTLGVLTVEASSFL